MKGVTIITLLLFYFFTGFAQNQNGIRIFSDVENVFWTAYFNNKDDGYQCLLSDNRKQIDTNDISPGLLIQSDIYGEIVALDSLRKYFYQFAYRIDTILLIGSYHYQGAQENYFTHVFEVTNLHGKIIQSFSHDFYYNSPFGAGIVQVNDSIYYFAQNCSDGSFGPVAVFYRVNIYTLEITKSLSDNAALNNHIIKLDDVPTYLEWFGGLQLKDSTFVTKDKVKFDTMFIGQSGTLLPREDKIGWVGFGSCITPSNFYGLCMIALDDKLKLDKVDLVYHPPSNKDFFPAFYEPFIRSKDAYYAAAMWDAHWFKTWYFADTVPTQIMVAKYDMSFDRVWVKIVGGDRRYLPLFIKPWVDGGFAVAGSLMDNLNEQKLSAFIMFFNEEGEIVGNELPDAGHYEFTIYGNPGREALRIMSRFEGYRFQLQVVDMMGRPVLNTTLAEGMNHFDTAWWPSGPYLMSITDDHGRVVWSQPWIRE